MPGCESSMTSHRRPNWPTDRIEKLRELHAQGLAFSQIARALGDVTRNGCISKAHRIGLESRASGFGQAKTHATITLPKSPPPPNAAPKPAPPPPAPPAPAPKPAIVEVATVEPIKLVDIGYGSCRWPLWNDTDGAATGFPSCGRTKERDSVYCGDHARRAFQPAPVRRSRGAPTGRVPEG